MEKWRAIYQKYREVIRYVFFGGLTTVVNYAVYLAATRLCSLDELTSTVISFVLSVLFAYVTNRIWVFESRAAGFSAVAREIAAFFGGRIFSGALDLLITFIFITWLGWYDLLVKIASNVLIIVLNYIISKWIVFRNREERPHGDS